MEALPTATLSLALAAVANTMVKPCLNRPSSFKKLVVFFFVLTDYFNLL